MFSFTGILSKDARMSPVVVSGSISGSLATHASPGFFWFLSSNSTAQISPGQALLDARRGCRHAPV
jgi:hypothetical protein